MRWLLDATAAIQTHHEDYTRSWHLGLWAASRSSRTGSTYMLAVDQFSGHLRDTEPGAGPLDV